MTAAVSIRVCTGENAGTVSAAVTGIDLISADNATNSAGNRMSYPVTTSTNSYEKWIKAYIDTAPDNKVENFLVWGDGTVMANTSLNIGVVAVGAGATPVATTSAVADSSWGTYVSGNKLAWDATSYHDQTSVTKYLVFQLVVGAAATAGNWTQETINYSYDEA